MNNLPYLGPRKLGKKPNLRQSPLVNLPYDSSCSHVQNPFTCSHPAGIGRVFPGCYHSHGRGTKVVNKFEHAHPDGRRPSKYEASTKPFLFTRFVGAHVIYYIQAPKKPGKIPNP